jgi:hypothetical protein
MDIGALVFGSLIVAILVYGVYQWHTGRLNPDLDDDGDFDSDDLYGLLWKIERAVEVFAPAADQLVKIGELDKADRKGYVLTMVYSLLGDVDSDLVDAVLESWVGTNKGG